MVVTIDVRNDNMITTLDKSLLSLLLDTLTMRAMTDLLEMYS